MAYKTEIEIGVKGAERLRQLQKQVEKVSNAIDLLGARDLFENKALQNINTYNKALKEASRNLEAVKLGTLEETKAIKLYVDALGDANAAQSRQNAQIQQEINLRERAARIRKLPPTQAATQFDAPIGPQPASFLTGISSPVAGRIQKIKAAQAAMIAAEKQVDKTRKALETQFTQTQIENDELVTKRKIELLDKETQRAIANSKKENDAALKDFDQRLAARSKDKERGRERGQRLESLALGAGFPLLFGGGAGQVLGGVAGSFVGSGFGGQILGSAIGGGIEEFLGGIADLGNALSATKPNLDALTEALGGANSEVGERIRLIERLEGKTAALEEAQRELTNLIGGDGIASIQQYAQDTNTIGSEFSKFFTIMQANIAELINSSGILKSIIEQVGRATLLAQAERGKEKDPQLALLFAQRENAAAGARGPGLTAMSNFQFMGPDPVEEGRIRLEIEDQIIKRQAELNAARNAGKQTQLEELRLRFAALENEKRLKAEAREKEQARITELRIQQSGVQIQLNQLNNEQKIFGIRQQAATAGLQLEQARFDAELSTFQLQETRLKRELETLQKKGIAFNRQKELVSQIAQNQIRQAKIEAEVAKLRIRQNIAQAKAARQQIDFEVRRINLQIELLRLKAMEEDDDKRRAARLRAVNASAKLANSLTREMVEAANHQLKAAVAIGREQEKILNNVLRGKIESIEAGRIEAERAVTFRAIAAAAGKAADETARMNSSMSRGSGTGFVGIGSGPRKGRTASTSMRIDPDVEAAVKASKPMGFRDIFELTEALDEAQRIKNANMLARSNFYASPSAYGARPSPASGRGTATVNVNTGPVMQFDNEKYVSMKDFELALSELSRSQAASSRSYAGRTYGGVG